MADRIDKFLAKLSKQELAECRDRIDKLIRPRRPGRPRGRSQDDYHNACRQAARAVLRMRQDWFDDNPDRKRAPNNFIAEAIKQELSKHDVLVRRKNSAEAAIKRHVDTNIRMFLPRHLISNS